MACSDNSFWSATRQMEVPYAAQNFMSQYMPQYPVPSVAFGTTPIQPLPTGIPGTPMYGGAPPTAAAPVPTLAAQPPQTLQSSYYTAGYLRRFIGRMVRVEFLIGTNGPLVDRIGTLTEVGASYIVLRPYMTNDTLICDLYSIKFVTVYG
ncbi:MAG: hypothetical protein HPY74_18515 [Firmicutes bacterium]|nr:hypothetical protein [Bacillota bacterium]